MSSEDRKKRTPTDRAFGVLRQGRERKADAVFVCKLYRQDDGSWDTDASFRHWIKGLSQEERDSLPAGVPGAVMGAVSSKPIQKHLGRILRTAATNVLTPHVGETAAEIVGDIIGNFTSKD